MGRAPADQVSSRMRPCSAPTPPLSSRRRSSEMRLAGGEGCRGAVGAGRRVRRGGAARRGRRASGAGAEATHCLSAARSRASSAAARAEEPPSSPTAAPLPSACAAGAVGATETSSESERRTRSSEPSGERRTRTTLTALMAHEPAGGPAAARAAPRATAEWIGGVWKESVLDAGEVVERFPAEQPREKRVSRVCGQRAKMPERRPKHAQSRTPFRYRSETTWRRADGAR